MTSPERLKCPRCQVLLQQDDYDGHPVWFCGACWGYWLTQQTLDAILAEHTRRMAAGERWWFFGNEASHYDPPEPHEDPSEPIACPVCGATLARKHFEEGCPVVIDQCYRHGVWLDPGELKELRLYLESRPR